MAKKPLYKLKGDPKSWRDPKTKLRKLIKTEEDGSTTIAHVLQINDVIKLHSWDEPALVNKKQRISFIR